MERRQIEAVAISRDDVEKAVSVKEVVDVVEEANRIYGADETVADYHHTLFDNVPPGRVPDPHANFQSFSAYLKAGFDVHGIASCGSCPHNPKQFGLPYLMGLIVLNDRKNGAPLAVIEMSRLVELVTAAASAVGTRHLANPDAQTLGILGCGQQGRTHVAAIGAVRNIKKIVAFDRHAETLAKFRDDISRQTGASVTAAGSAEEVVRSADILAVLISAPKPTVKYEWLKPGALLIAASGFGQELYKEGCYRNADRLVMDDWGSIMDACLTDIGASDDDRRLDGMLLRNWKEWKENGDAAKMTDRLIKGDYGLEIPQIILGRQKGRLSAVDKVIFVHAGMSTNMVAAGYLVWKRALEKGLGVKFRVL